MYLQVISRRLLKDDPRVPNGRCLVAPQPEPFELVNADLNESTAALSSKV